MNRRPIEAIEEPPCDNVEDLKKMIAETQRLNKLLQSDISNITRSNESKKSHNRRIKEKARIMHEEMQRLVDDHMRIFEESRCAAS